MRAASATVLAPFDRTATNPGVTARPSPIGICIAAARYSHTTASRNHACIYLACACELQHPYKLQQPPEPEFQVCILLQGRQGKVCT
jgi:hypothetical protein